MSRADREREAIARVNDLAGVGPLSFRRVVSIAADVWEERIEWLEAQAVRWEAMYEGMKAERDSWEQDYENVRESFNYWDYERRQTDAERAAYIERLERVARQVLESFDVPHHQIQSNLPWPSLEALRTVLDQEAPDGS